MWLERCAGILFYPRLLFKKKFAEADGFNISAHGNITARVRVYVG